MALGFQSLGSVLIGPKGDKGEIGDQGKKGNQGVTGGAGQTGDTGEHGLTFIITTAKINEGTGITTSFLISTCNMNPVEGDYIISADNEVIGIVTEIIETDNIPTNVTVEFVAKIKKPNAGVLMIPENHIYNTGNYDSATYDSPQEQAEAEMAAWETSHPTEETAFAWRNNGESGYSVSHFIEKSE
jgi:hypothetical protein